MKITDYGIWFSDFAEEIWLKYPNESSCSVWLYGHMIGHLWASVSAYWVYTESIARIGLKISDNAPGMLASSKNIWDFPENYIPCESDFEEISEEKML